MPRKINAELKARAVRMALQRQPFGGIEAHRSRDTDGDVAYPCRKRARPGRRWIQRGAERARLLPHALAAITGIGLTSLLASPIGSVGS